MFDRIGKRLFLGFLSSLKMLTTMAAISILTQMLYLMIMPITKKMLSVNDESIS